MAHPAALGPFCEFHLGDELRLDPSDRSIHRDFFFNGRSAGDEWFHLRREIFQDLAVKARACVSGKDEFSFFMGSEDEGAEIFPESPGLGEADNDSLVRFYIFYLEPVA